MGLSLIDVEVFYWDNFAVFAKDRYCLDDNPLRIDQNYLN